MLTFKSLVSFLRLHENLCNSYSSLYANGKNKSVIIWEYMFYKLVVRSQSVSEFTPEE